MRLHILQYKRKWEEKSIHFGQQSFRDVFFFFPLFIFSQGGEPEVKGDRKKRFTKSQSAKGCIFNNFCGFSLITSCSLKQWNVR